MIKKITIFAGIFCLLAIFINAFYTHPSTDDYAYYNNLSEMGFWKFQKWHYLEWGGRYIPNALIGSFYPSGINGIFIYRLLAVGIALSVYASLHLFVKEVLELKDDYFFTANLLFIGYCFSLYSFAQEFYWFPGSITYTLGVIMFPICWSLIKNSNNWWVSIATLLSIILINGTNEITMLFFNSSLLLYLIFKLLKREKINPNFYIFAVFSFCFFLIGILAPGNTVRAAKEYNPNAKNLLFAIPRGLKWSFVFFYERFFLLVPLALIVANYIKKPLLQLDIRKKNVWLFKLASILFPFFVLIGGVSLSYFGNGRIPPGRAVNVIAFFFLAALIFSCVFYKDNFGLHFLKRQSKVSIYTIIVIFAAVIFIPNELRMNIFELFSGKSAQFNREMNSRVGFMQSTIKQDIEVEKVSVAPVTIFYNDISTDPNYFFNIHYARFYNKRSVKLKEK